MWKVVTNDVDWSREGQTFETETEARLYMKEELMWENTESCELYDGDGAMVEHVVGSFTD